MSAAFFARKGVGKIGLWQAKRLTSKGKSSKLNML